MRVFLRLGLALLIVAGTGMLIRRIAVARNEALAGGGAYRLGPEHPPAWNGWRHLVGHVEQAGATSLLAELTALHEEGRIWVAPRLPREQRAIWAGTLGLVSRVYVAERELTQPPHVLAPDLRVPPLHLDAWAWVSLSATLAHEMAHARGVVSEPGAYEIEILWLQGIPSLPGIRSLPPDNREAVRWAVETALGNARKARALEERRSREDR